MIYGASLIVIMLFLFRPPATAASELHNVSDIWHEPHLDYVWLLFVPPASDLYDVSYMWRMPHRDYAVASLGTCDGLTLATLCLF